MVVFGHVWSVLVVFGRFLVGFPWLSEPVLAGVGRFGPVLVGFGRFYFPLSCSIVLPVLGPGFRSRFWAGAGRKPSADGPKTGPGRRPGQPRKAGPGDRKHH